MTGAVGRRFFLYNTVCEVVLCRWSGDADALLNECEKLAQDVQRMLNRYDEGSELSQLNRLHTPGVPHPVSKALCAFLTRLNAFSRESDGAFDATLAPLMRLWNFTAPSPRAPDEAQIRAALTRTGYRRVKIDGERRTVTFLAPGMSLDAGGAGKGYAVEVVAGHLRARGVRSGSVNFGGNLCVIGLCEEDGVPPRPWQAGLQKPWAPRGECMGLINLNDLSTATSAGYDRFFARDGHLYHHILDPATGHPASRGVLAATVVASEPMLTDLMSTALFVLGPARGAQLAQRLRGDRVLEYLIVTQHGTQMSGGMRALFVPSESRQGGIHS